jgi:hypothetical protein
MKKDINHIYLVMLVALCFVFTPHHVFAIAVDPLRQTVVVDPGQSYTGTIEIVNDSNNNERVQFSADSFHIDDDGRAVFGGDDPAKLWITFSDEASSVASGKSFVLDYTIHVPADAEPRSHYLSLFASVAASTGTIQLGSRVGSLLFLHVGGTVQEKLIVKSVSSNQHNIFEKNLTYSAIFKNEGTIHVVPEGEIYVTNWLGHVIGIFPINPTNRKILPETEWKKNYILGELKMIDSGPVTIHVTGRYGVTRQTFSMTHTVWYISKNVAALIVLIFIILIFFWKRKIFYVAKAV